ncbi:GIY-YIG nuclease family protein [Paenibacillus sp. KQZ6P-2]|uniref:GIY-YIG nuclease family protein n=1 Tax=Paenibacillus mangrovi TaxID=2931978 RepID=A0A9X1WRX2_9BACL|nr:GIY-YIG nuclease family protein [Paenibacillus mangrovi]MCJ8014242.1 GIY-YIG nuclease family protein [Paenibacillus mangrovi]
MRSTSELYRLDAPNTAVQEKVQNLPLTPGVYLMKDAHGGIIYVGKSKSLKKRVQSYFYNNKSHAPKIKKLVQHVKDLDIIQTDTEFEAFMLECSLIHRYKPMYNRKMKNPLAYTYIVIPAVDGLRRIKITNCLETAPDRIVFGPYTAGRITVEKAVEQILECFKIACSQTVASASRPCLNHSLGLCLGMCLGGSSLLEYNQLMDRFIGLLDGSDKSLYEEMEKRMTDAAERFDFEAAAKWRDCVQSVQFLRQKEKVIEYAEQNCNIVIYEHMDDETIKLFLIKRSSILFSRKFSVNENGLGMGQLQTEIKMLIWGYFKRDESAYSEEVVRDEIDEAQIVYSYLQSSADRYLVIPDEWLEMEEQSKLDQGLELWLNQQQG